MKKITAFIVIAALCLTLCAATAREWTERQETAHQIAELARSMGLPEDDPIIMRAQELWWSDFVEDDNAEEAPDTPCPVEEVPEDELPTPWYTQQDIDIIACVVYNEAGYGCTDRHQELVAAVVVNRVNDSRFPGTVYGVVTQPYQYSVSYATYGSYYMTRAMQSDIWSHCCEIAERALRGEVVCPVNVVFQANFAQGTGTYELGYTSYSVTYFCYG